MIKIGSLMANTDDDKDLYIVIEYKDRYSEPPARKLCYLMYSIRYQEYFWNDYKFVAERYKRLT